MSGGANDTTMSVYNNLLGSSGFTQAEYDSIPNHHITKYTTPTVNLLNGVGMDFDKTIYGDGIYETSIGARRFNRNGWNGGNDRGGWNTEYSYLPHASGPWFHRGARLTLTSLAGLGAFGTADGSAPSYHSFRPIVSIK